MQQENNFLASKALEAIDAATIAAIEKARRTNTNLVVWRDGKIIEITPEEAEAMLREQEKLEGQTE